MYLILPCSMNFSRTLKKIVSERLVAAIDSSVVRLAIILSLTTSNKKSNSSVYIKNSRGMTSSLKYSSCSTICSIISGISFIRPNFLFIKSTQSIWMYYESSFSWLLTPRSNRLAFLWRAIRNIIAQSNFCSTFNKSEISFQLQYT